ncbi:hypothetical protein [Salinispora pacifica]|uniref:hypothetical protein n=1 Tax=Salinispora pacifica TaxID=351187 RepID=UPI0003827709|nr:hypothetical protein [Salinispora pacifica]
MAAVNGYQPYREGAEVWLVPVLMTAPTAAYGLPACEVVRVTAVDRVRVRLADGTEVETSTRNLRRTPPEEEPKPPRAREDKRRLALPPGYSEPTLW